MGERAKVILNEYSAKNLLMRDTLDLDKFYTADLKLFVEVARKEIERLNNKHNKALEKIDKALEKINDYKIYCENNKGFTEYTDIEIEAIEPVISKLEDILKEEK